MSDQDMRMWSVVTQLTQLCIWAARLGLVNAPPAWRWPPAWDHSVKPASTPKESEE